jgi:hypothetical protein
MTEAKARAMSDFTDLEKAIAYRKRAEAAETERAEAVDLCNTLTVQLNTARSERDEARKARDHAITLAYEAFRERDFARAQLETAIADIGVREAQWQVCLARAEHARDEPLEDRGAEEAFGGPDPDEEPPDDYPVICGACGAPSTADQCLWDEGDETTPSLWVCRRCQDAPDGEEETP